MKTLKLSLSALVAMCYLVLFTACQDDAVENEVLPAQDAENHSQTSVPDDVLQLLHSVAESSPGVEANPGARTDRPFVLEYDLSLTVSELDFPGQQPREELQTLDGRLTLWPTDSLDSFNFIDLNGRDFQL